MKRCAFVLSVVLAAIAGLLVPSTAAHANTRASSSQLAGASSRQKVNFNRGWRFIRSDVAGAQNTGFDDSTWVPVALPHDFDAPYNVAAPPAGRPSTRVWAGIASI